MSNNRTRKQAKKAAAEPLSELEKAIRAIDLATESANAAKERKPCYCLATKHKLNVFAPNCLNCGKIICALEGPGPCTYCGKPVVSVDQQQAMVLELKREKAALAKQQAMATATRKNKAAVVSTAGYASKLGGGMTSATGSAGGWVELNGGTPTLDGRMTEEEELQEAMKASLAQAHKEKLLEYDRTSARRSHVIDQATDFVLPGDRPNLWLTEEERQHQSEKARQNLDKVTAAASGYQRAKVMTIDVVNRRVVVEAAAQVVPEEEEDDSVPEPTSLFDLAKSTSISGGNKHGGRGGAFAMNPLLRMGESPTFIAKSSQSSGGKNSKSAKEAKEKVLKIRAEKPKVPRLQYDEGSYEALMDDSQILFSSGSDSQAAMASIVEPSCG
ncbi:activating signal cointegrator 1 [Entomortierella parvispora]|uniref:Activating signal cointegrator 1 n=1 Tax=Entomortierella parvispora TaxID=205924 RepID=A0A9P3LXE3_9FUNG|nr:activating signal cointegrator 1 [Entomortierella parvispora]